jgi:hypothetical protein
MVILNEIRVKHKHPNTGWPRNESNFLVMPRADFRLEQVLKKLPDFFDKDALKIKELEHVGIEKVAQFFRDML